MQVQAADIFFHVHDYKPVKVTVRPSPAHPRSSIRVSLKAPFDLQPGDRWCASFMTCVRVAHGRLKTQSDRGQVVDDKPFVGGGTTGSTARVTLRRSDINTTRSQRRRWCAGKAALLIVEGNPDAEDVRLVEILQLKGGVDGSHDTPDGPYSDVFKPVRITA